MKLTLNHNTYQRMMAYVDNCPNEISGLGKVQKDGNDYIVTDIALFEQDVSAAHSDITAQALAKFQVELIRKGESLENWCFWWHSHAKMDVFFSGTDTATIDSSTDFPYLISLVTNHAHDFIARIDVYQHARLHADMQVFYEVYSGDINQECIKEIEQKVSTAKHWSTKPVSTSHNMGFNDPLNDYGYNNSYQRLPEPYTPKVIDIESEEDLGFESFSDISNRQAGSWTISQIQEGLDKVGTDEYAQAVQELDDQILECEQLLDIALNDNDRDLQSQLSKRLRQLSELDGQRDLNYN